MAEDRGALLKAACDAAVNAPELRPEYSAKEVRVMKTFCNIGAQRIAKAMGCDELDAPNVEENADVLHEIMSASKRWKKVEPRTAVIHALDGGLAFAAMTSKQLKEDHGHICAVRPEAMQLSGSLGYDVPMLANVGSGDPDAPLVATTRVGVKTKQNWNCKASQAFPMKSRGEPDYFIYL